MLFIAGAGTIALMTQLLIKSEEPTQVMYEWIFLDAESVEKLGVEIIDIQAAHKGNLLLPCSSVLDLPEGRFAYVRDFDLPDSFIRVPVEVGKVSPESIEIVKGLFPGDQIASPASTLASQKALQFSTEHLARLLDAPTHSTEHEADNFFVRLHQRIRHFIGGWKGSSQSKFSSCSTH